MLEKKKIVHKGETFGERYGQQIFDAACFGLTKKAGFSVLMINGEKAGVAVLWIAEVVEFLQLRNRRLGEEKEVGFVQYMEVRVPLGVVDKTLG